MRSRGIRRNEGPNRDDRGDGRGKGKGKGHGIYPLYISLSNRKSVGGGRSGFRGVSGDGVAMRGGRTEGKGKREGGGGWVRRGVERWTILVCLLGTVWILQGLVWKGTERMRMRVRVRDGDVVGFDGVGVSEGVGDFGTFEVVSSFFRKRDLELVGLGRGLESGMRDGEEEESDAVVVDQGSNGDDINDHDKKKKKKKSKKDKDKDKKKHPSNDDPTSEDPDPDDDGEEEGSDTESLLDYLSLYDSIPAPLGFMLLLLWLMFLFAFVGIVASDFFCPNLGTIAGRLGLGESLTGVTFLAFGNGSPDVFSTFSAMKAHSGSLAIGELLGAASFIVSVVAGSMTLIRPFRVAKHPFLRDVGFFTLASSLTLVILADGKILAWEAAAMVCLYVVYVAVVAGGSWWMGWRRRKRELERKVRSEFLDGRLEVDAEEGEGGFVEPYRDDPTQQQHQVEESRAQGRSRSGTLGPRTPNRTPPNRLSPLLTPSTNSMFFPGTGPVSGPNSPYQTDEDALISLIENDTPVTLTRRLTVSTGSGGGVGGRNRSSSITTLQLPTSSLPPPISSSSSTVAAGGTEQLQLQTPVSPGPSQSPLLSGTGATATARRPKSKSTVRPSLLGAIEFRDVVNSLRADSGWERGLAVFGGMGEGAVVLNGVPRTPGSGTGTGVSGVGDGVWGSQSLGMSFGPPIVVGGGGEDGKHPRPGRTISYHGAGGSKSGSNFPWTPIEATTPGRGGGGGRGHRRKYLSTSLDDLELGSSGIGAGVGVGAGESGGLEPPSPREARGGGGGGESHHRNRNRQHHQHYHRRSQSAQTRLDYDDVRHQVSTPSSPSSSSLVEGSDQGDERGGLYARDLIDFSVEDEDPWRNATPKRSSFQPRVDDMESDGDGNGLGLTPTGTGRPARQALKLHIPDPASVPVGQTFTLSSPDAGPDTGGPTVAAPKGGSDDNQKIPFPSTERGGKRSNVPSIMIIDESGESRTHTRHHTPEVHPNNAKDGLDSYFPRAAGLPRAAGGHGSTTIAVEKSTTRSRLRRFRMVAGAIFTSLFPSLQGLRSKSFTGIILAFLAVPAIFLLNLTLPVVDDDAEVWDELDEMEAAAEASAHGGGDPQATDEGQAGQSHFEPYRDDPRSGSISRQSREPEDYLSEDSETDTPDERRRKASQRESRIAHELHSPVVARHRHHDHHRQKRVSLGTQLDVERVDQGLLRLIDDDEEDDGGDDGSTPVDGRSHATPVAQHPPNGAIGDAPNPASLHVKGDQSPPASLVGGTKSEDEDTCEVSDLVLTRWLTTVQCTIAPVFVVVAVQSEDFQLWQFPIALAVGLVLGSLAYYVLYDPRSPTRVTLCFVGFVVAVVWIMTIVNEVVGVLQAFGKIFGLSDAIIGVSIFAIGNSLGDLVANVTIARLGYPVMAISACFGGPMLNILLGVGISASVMIAQTGEPYVIDFSPTLMVSGVALVIVLVSTLIYVPLAGFMMSRKWGIVLILAYCVVLAVNIVVEINISRKRS